MTKSELIRTLKIKYAHLSEKVLKTCVDLFFDEIQTALKQGRRVELRGFGTLVPRDRDERVARNPKTGEKVMLGKHRTTYFRAGKELRELVNQE
ncbi:MAG: integration host factor subunit beta [Alphaproteobacteria bacterium]|nr:integration host factor subunit beta [Alphaproteobacteria bacterium]